MGRKKTVFKGCATALVTPFKNGGIDYYSLGELIDFQINNGTDAIVLLGTTGEASTVTDEERNEIIPFAKERIRSRVPLIVGTGSNSTKTAIKHTRCAESQGADACLVVTPYYNKATANGLTEHFLSIAKSVKIPIILYNVPSRTGMSIPMKTYGELSRVDNIVAVKEACQDIAYISELITRYGDDYDVYSGCDELVLPILSLGGKGVISVASNVIPSYMHQMCAEFMYGSFEKSKEIKNYVLPLIRELFSEINPIPVKAFLSKMKMCENELRLPMSKSTREREITKLLKDYGLI